MAARAIIKAYRIKCALDRLAEAKENSLRAMAGLPPLRSWFEGCYITCMQGLRTLCCKAFCPCCIKPAMPKPVPKHCCGRLYTANTYENECVKNFIGFICGIGLSFCLYLLMVLQMNMSVPQASVISAGFGLVFSLGLAFSLLFRCVLMLMVPAFCSSKGRSFLLMYATILILNNPVTNFNHNIIVMSECATCGQNMAINETKQLLDEALSPIGSLIDGIRDMVEGIRRFANTIRRAFKSLKRAINELSDAIQSVFNWLRSIVHTCNKKMSDPYWKCRYAFNDAIDSCKAAIGQYNLLCNIVSDLSVLCNIVRVGELFCIITQEITKLVRGSLGKPVTKVLDEVSNMFYFKVSINYHYKLTMKQSRSYKEVKKAIMDDIKGALRHLNEFINVVDQVMMWMVGFVVLKAIMYRYKYLTKDRFDNAFITSYLERIDSRREELDRETVFPMTADECRKYGTTFTATLSLTEKKKLAKGIILWIFAASHGGFYIMCDFGLYWILDLIRTHFNIKTDSLIPPHLKLHVQGEGAMADMYRKLVTILDPISDYKLDIDTTECLPNPSKPNYAIYKTVVAIYLLCLVMSILDGYINRTRHVIAGCYYPKREYQRAMWLHNHILRTRGGFLKFTRRQLRRKYRNGKDIQKASIRSRLAAHYPCLGKIFKFFGFDRKFCLLCGKEGRKQDTQHFLNCANVDCDAVYCLDCYDDLQNTCTVCMDPVDYGDMSDFSEEHDSSEEDEIKLKIQEGKKRKQKRQLEQRPSNLLLKFKDTLGIRPVSSNQDEEARLMGDADASESDYSDSSAEEDYSYQFVKPTGSRPRLIPK